MAGTAHLELAQFRREPNKSVQLALELREVREERPPATLAEIKVLNSCFSAHPNSCKRRGDHLRSSGICYLLLQMSSRKHLS